jgi:hypothetical protein
MVLITERGTNLIVRERGDIERSWPIIRKRCKDEDG